MTANRTTLAYVRKHAFDSACSRVIGRVSMDREDGRSPVGYLLARFVGNLLKAPAFGLLALVTLLCAQTGTAKKSFVRCWRSCGYLYQIPRSLFGPI